MPVTIPTPTDEALVELLGLEAVVNNNEAYECLEHGRDLVSRVLLVDRDELTIERVKNEVGNLRKELGFDENRNALDSSLIARNIDRLTRYMGLTEAESDVLLFAVSASLSPLLRELIAKAKIRDVDDLTMFIYGSLCSLGGQSYEQYGAALSQKSVLVSGYLIAHCDGRNFHRKDNTISRVLWVAPELMEYVLSEEPDELALCHGTIPKPVLGKEDFAFMPEELATGCAYLRSALPGTGAHADEVETRGANIAILALPGSGKSSLAAVMASEAGFEPVFLNAEKRSARVDGEGQFFNYKLAQKLLDPQRHVLVVENVDDVFYDINDSAEWMYRLTSTNRVSTIWLWNDGEPAGFLGNDKPMAACAAAYGMVVNLTAHHKAVNAAVLRKAVPAMYQGHAGIDALVGRYANTRLDARHIGRAMEVAANTSVDAEAFHVTVGRLLLHALQAIGGTPEPLAPKPSESYNIAHSNASMPLPQLLEGLRHCGEGRVCLYGPPGTGKTAFARHVAQQLGKSLLVKKGSDLFGYYVGQTEKAIAAAFEEAADNGSILLIDEADSFLVSRETASRNWEVSFTNELLQQMEDFTGIFIATTNRFDHLDKAAMRRFDFKVGLGYLQPDAVIAMVQGLLGGQTLPPRVASHLRNLDRLTPGDFAVLARQVRIAGIQPTPEWVLQGLCDEVAQKGEVQCRPIGFVH